MILEQAAQENWNQSINVLLLFRKYFSLGNQKLAAARAIGVLQAQVRYFYFQIFIDFLVG